MVKIGHPSMSAAFEPPEPAFEPPERKSFGGVMSKSTLDVIEEYFNGNWRLGQEIHEVAITQRLYQTSPTSTQA